MITDADIKRINELYHKRGEKSSKTKGFSLHFACGLTSLPGRRQYMHQ